MRVIKYNKTIGNSLKSSTLSKILLRNFGVMERLLKFCTFPSYFPTYIKKLGFLYNEKKSNLYKKLLKVIICGSN